jgi:hypothetical protein
MFQRLMNAAIERESYGFLEKYDTRDELRKYFNKNFDFQGKIAPKEIKEGDAVSYADIRKFIKDGHKRKPYVGTRPRGYTGSLYDGGVLYDKKTTVTLPNGQTKEAVQAAMTPAYLKFKLYASGRGGRRALAKELLNRLKSDNAEGQKELRRRLGLNDDVSASVVRKRIRSFEGAKESRVNKAMKDRKTSQPTDVGRLAQAAGAAKQLEKWKQRSATRANREYALDLEKFNRQQVRNMHDAAHKAATAKASFIGQGEFDAANKKKAAYEAEYKRYIEEAASQQKAGTGFTGADTPTLEAKGVITDNTP